MPEAGLVDVPRRQSREAITGGLEANASTDPVSAHGNSPRERSDGYARRHHHVHRPLCDRVLSSAGELGPQTARQVPGIGFRADDRCSPQSNLRAPAPTEWRSHWRAVGVTLLCIVYIAIPRFG